MLHVFKTHPAHFQMIWSGLKSFECRVDDRAPRITIGDSVFLQEWDPTSDTEENRHIRAQVGYVVRDAPQYGVASGFVVFGLLDIDRRSLTLSESTSLDLLRKSIHAPAIVPPEVETPADYKWAALDCLHRLSTAIDGAIMLGRFPDPGSVIHEALNLAHVLVKAGDHVREGVKGDIADGA